MEIDSSAYMAGTKTKRTVQRQKLAPVQTPTVTQPAVEVVGRVAERDEIRAFLEKYVLPSDGAADSGSTLYVSGCPGTGKTLSVTSTVAEFAANHGQDSFAFVSVNAMGIGSAIGIFDAISGQLAELPLVKQTGRRGGGAKRKRELAEFCAQVQDGVEKVISVLKTCEKPVLVLVDEVDRLVPSLAASKNRSKRKANVLEVELLTALLRLPFIVPSTVRISIIGIANSMDLALNLESFYGRKCVAQALAFKPYTADELRAIVHATLALQEAELVGDQGSEGKRPRKMEAAAVELCVRKIASLHGDCRKVMDVCRQAVSAEKSGAAGETVTIMETARLLDDCYKGAFDSEAALKALPLQQLLVLASACKVAVTQAENDEWPIHVLRAAVLETAHQLNLPATHTTSSTSALVDQTIFLSQCGLLSLKDSGKGRLGSWKLQIPPEALKHTLTATNSLIANALASNDNFI